MSGKQWTNYETYLAHTWLTDDPDDEARYSSIGAEDVRNLELTMRDDVLAMAPECYGLPYYLLQRAIDAINFEEIAKHIASEARPETIQQDLTVGDN